MKYEREAIRKMDRNIIRQHAKVSPITEEEATTLVNTFISDNHIDTSSWSRPTTKTIDDLINEVHAHECVFGKFDNKPVRIIRVVKCDIYYRTPEGNLYKLKQVTKIKGSAQDGKKIINDAKFGSVSGKAFFHEDPWEAAHREISEETGLDDVNITRAVAVSTRYRPEGSKSYPGLPILNIEYRFPPIFLSPGQFKQEGYREETLSKTTEFSWVEIKAN